MPYETEERLKGYLDTNQLHREQMCLAILAVDRRFSEVRPRHPRGGPDGGRDIEALFDRELRAFGAVGFLNQANDSTDQKSTIGHKFSEDLQRALQVQPPPEAFFFLTNVSLTITEKEKLVAQSKGTGIVVCEILDRERLRISLDSPDGFAIRFQFLGLPLSDAEQASFFARWGDDIQSVIATSFQKLEETMKRVLFLQEAQSTMSSLVFKFELDREYTAGEIGHFRAFCYMQLKGPIHRIFGIRFGCSDKSNRMRTDQVHRSKEESPGIKYGISGGQWEEHIRDESSIDIFSDDCSKFDVKQVGSSSSVGIDPVQFITIRYEHDHFIRQVPRLRLIDIDESLYIFSLNKSLADKVTRIHAYSSGYKLQEIPRTEFRIDTDDFHSGIPVEFSNEELSDEWVRIRPAQASGFSISFFDQTPVRVFDSRQTPNSLARVK